jgi:hypothetical protein
MPRYLIMDAYDNEYLGMVDTEEEAVVAVQELNSYSDRFVWAIVEGNRHERLLERIRSGATIWQVTIARRADGSWTYDKHKHGYMSKLYRTADANMFVGYYWASDEHHAVAQAKADFNELLPALDHAYLLASQRRSRDANNYITQKIQQYNDEFPIT